MNNSEIKKVAKILTNSEPLDFALKDDGTLVVIAANGMKFKFPPERVESVLAASKLAQKPKAKKTTSSTTKNKPGRPPKAAQKPQEPKK